jgi:hypothetical protein
MSPRTRVITTSLVATLIALGMLSMGAQAQETPALEGTTADAAGGGSVFGSGSSAPSLLAQAAGAASAASAESPGNTRGIVDPPSPLQTAGALAGALFAILLAIAGVTVTFRSMRNEMRRARGHSRRPSRSGRTTLPQT